MLESDKPSERELFLIACVRKVIEKYHGHMTEEVMATLRGIEDALPKVLSKIDQGLPEDTDPIARKLLMKGVSTMTKEFVFHIKGLAIDLNNRQMNWLDDADDMFKKDTGC